MRALQNIRALARVHMAWDDMMFLELYAVLLKVYDESTFSY